MGMELVAAVRINILLPIKMRLVALPLLVGMSLQLVGKKLQAVSVIQAIKKLVQLQ